MILLLVYRQSLFLKILFQNKNLHFNYIHNISIYYRCLSMMLYKYICDNYYDVTRYFSNITYLRDKISDNMFEFFMTFS